MFNSKSLLLFFGFALGLLVTGCADPVVFGEVFQLEKDQELCTRYNIWYDDPQDVSCLNIQHGSFIPLGTVIEPIGTDSFNDSIRFRVKSTGREFAISFSEAYRLCSMRDYIAYTFCVGNPLDKMEFSTDQAKLIRERIIRGEVVHGMNRDQVELAYGPPPAVRTPDKRNETWIYWRSGNRQVRVIFRDDVVRSVLSFNDEN
ncbi:MAG: hypothetical protein J6R86_05945 [Lentisphaeria bacterium]|nr:hypothetical protein [Lentisphaeria bacterium]